MYKKFAIAAAAIGLSACSTVMQSLPASDYASYVFNGLEFGIEQINSGRSGLRSVGGMKYLMSPYPERREIDLKNDQEYPLSFAGIFDRPSKGPANIDLSGDWRKVGDEAVRVVNKYSYNDIKEGMRGKPISEVLSFNRPGDPSSASLVIKHCKTFRGNLSPSSSNKECREQVLQKQSFDLEKLIGGSLLAKVFAAREYVSYLYTYGSFADEARRFDQGSARGSREYMYEAQRDIIESTKRYMAMAVLIKAYQDAHLVKPVKSGLAVAVAEDVDKYGVATIRLGRYVADPSALLFNIAANPWFGEHRYMLQQRRKTFATRVCQMLPMDREVIIKLFDFGDKKMMVRKNDVSKGSGGTFLSDPVKFGAKEYHLILSPERQNALAGESLVNDVDTCTYYFAEKLEKNHNFYNVTTTYGADRRDGIIPMSRGTGGGSWLADEGKSPVTIQPDTSEMTEDELAVLRAYVGKYLEKEEAFRQRYKLQ